MRPLVAAFALFLALPLVASAQAIPNVTLESCTPNASVAEDGTFMATEGEAVVFKCTLKNNGSTTAKVLLSGQRTKETASGLVPSASVSSAVSVSPKGTVAEIPFVAVFEKGTYQYTLILRNLADGKPFGTVLTFSSTLGGSSVRIAEAVFDTKAFAAGEDAVLSLIIATSSPGTGTPYILDAFVRGEDGSSCYYAELGKPITSTAQTVMFSPASLPADCVATGIGIVLKTASGFPQDSRDIPLGAPLSLGMFAFLVTVSLIALAWTLRLLRRRRTMIIAP